MLAIATAQPEGIESSPPPAPSTESPTLSSSVAQIHLTEKVYPSFDSAANRDPNRWILDTGASNHMTGAQSAASLNTGITGSVRFGDGSTARIEGSGIVLLSCKNGDHRSLSNDYYLPD
jgi:hypothetical protein